MLIAEIEAGLDSRRAAPPVCAQQPVVRNGRDLLQLAS